MADTCTTLMNRIVWLWAYVCWWLVVNLNLPWRVQLALLPWAGIYGYSNGFADWHERSGEHTQSNDRKEMR